MKNELEAFIEIWETEAKKTIQLLEALPRDQYDFRPDPEARSLGEMAWHLAEGEAYGALAIERGGFSRDVRPEGIARPRTIEELAPGFARIHGDALAAVRKLTPPDLDRQMTFIDGSPTELRWVLWNFMLLHSIHHRGQLALLCRQAGGQPVSLFGPTRETFPLRKPE